MAATGLGSNETSGPELLLDVYIRHGCHLCDEMIHVLSEFRNDYNFSIRTIDIDADAALRDKYNALVPVLCLGDEEICHHFFDLEAFSRVVPRRG